MDKSEDLKYQLQTLEHTDIETIEHCGGLLEIEYEDSHGIARFCTVAIPELGGQSLKRIAELEQRMKELEEAQKILTDYIELADETGYIEGHGFVDVEKYKYKPPKENE